MTHAARVLADSLSPDGVRLTTLEVTFPRIILAEFNTHRVFSRNSASSRAIPVEKMLRMVMDNPYIPSSWGKNQKGMQAEVDVDADIAAEATEQWLMARSEAAWRAQQLLNLGIHKQLTNRLLEPFMWHTCIVSSTEWSNWDHLRDNAKASPDIQLTARAMRAARLASTPAQLDYDAWHLPLIFAEDRAEALALAEAAPPTGEDLGARINGAILIPVSVGRCARVSYLTHDGKRDLNADVLLFHQLNRDGHMSPFEHVARPMKPGDPGVFESTCIPECFLGNFRGWVQYRKTIPHEHDILGATVTR